MTITCNANVIQQLMPSGVQWLVSPMVSSQGPLQLLRRLKRWSSWELLAPLSLLLTTTFSRNLTSLPLKVAPIIFRINQRLPQYYNPNCLNCFDSVTELLMSEVNIYKRCYKRTSNGMHDYLQLWLEK